MSDRKEDDCVRTRRCQRDRGFSGAGARPGLTKSPQFRAAGARTDLVPARGRPLQAPANASSKAARNRCSAGASRRDRIRGRWRHDRRLQLTSSARPSSPQHGHQVGPVRPPRPQTYIEDQGEVFLGRSVTQHKQVSDVTAHVMTKRSVASFDPTTRAPRHPGHAHGRAAQDGRSADEVRNDRRSANQGTSWQAASRNRPRNGTTARSRRRVRPGRDARNPGSAASAPHPRAALKTLASAARSLRCGSRTLMLDTPAVHGGAERHARLLFGRRGRHADPPTPLRRRVAWQPKARA